MKASPSQVSFNAGEWSSRLEGRSDLAKYTNACRRLRNFLPTVQGPAIKRSGTRFVKDVKDSADITRLIPFEFGTTQAYILEFGDLYCRVYMDNGGVLEATVAISAVAPSSPIEITTGAAHGYSTGQQVYINSSAVPGINSGYFHITWAAADRFTLQGTSSLGVGGAGGTVARVYEFSTDPGSGGYASADLDSIQYAQSADVLYLACPGYPPRKISRTDHDAWTIEDIAWEAPPFAQENLDKDDYMVAGAAAVDGVRATGTLNLYSTGGHFTADHVGSFVKLAETIEGIYPEWTSAGDSGLSGYWTHYKIGNNVFRASTENRFAFYEGRLYRLAEDYTASINGVAPPLHDDGMQSDGEWLWEHVNSGYGWVKITTVTDAYLAVGTVIRELGRTVFVVERQISSISAAAPPVVTTSANHEYETGDTIFLRGSLRAGVNDQTYTITRTGNTTFTLDGVGAAGAVVAGGVTLRVRTAEPTALTTAADRKRHVAATRWAFSAFSPERGYPACVAFFEDRLAWAGTESDPQGMWLSRTGRYDDHLYTSEDDGALFLLLNTQQVNRIEWISSGTRLAVGTAGGEFIIEGAQDGPLTAGNARARQQTFYGSRAAVAPVRVESVTLFVQRSGRKLIEFGYDEASQNYQGADLTVLAHHLALPKIRAMAWAQEPDRMLWVVFEDGSLAALTYDRGQEVVGWHPHVIGGASVAVKSVAVIPHPDGDRDQVWLIVSRTVNGATKQYVEYLEETWLQGSAIEDGFYVDSGLTYNAGPTASIVGLWHLLNTAVSVLADGVEVEGLSVSATTGTLTLPAAASKVHVGLAYDAELEPMLLEAGGADGTSGGKTKRITNVVLRLEDTGSGLTYGEAEDELAIDAGTLLTDDTEIRAWPDGYAKRSRLPIKHAGPTPCMLIAIFPQVHTEDR